MEKEKEMKVLRFLFWMGVAFLLGVAIGELTVILL